MNPKILDIKAIQIIDSRGVPTISASVLLEDGSLGKFDVPSGASTGKFEAVEKRDGVENYFFGKSVEENIKQISSLKEVLINKSFTQKEFDDFLISLDGTPNKKNFGANTILSLSSAFAKAVANSYNLELYEYFTREILKIPLSQKKKVCSKVSPNLFANILNGGVHSGNSLQIQEFMVVPICNSLKKSVQIVCEIYFELRKIIKLEFGAEQIGVGDEGGFAPNISKTKKVLDLILKAIEKTNYLGSVGIALDCAASEFYTLKTEKYEVEKGFFLSSKELEEFYLSLVRDYPIISFEDPFSEEDFTAFRSFSDRIKTCEMKVCLENQKEVFVVGDDLLVTQLSKVKKAQKEKLCNSLLLKINQVGTITESLEAFSFAYENDWKIIVSHRSGETCDSLISDLAVALSLENFKVVGIKLGSPARGERIAKYNRLLEIFEV